MYSTTKYVAGHSDVLGGAAVTNDQAVADTIKFNQNATGGVPGPLDCFLVLRGAKTLAIRMQTHDSNARAVAQFLAARDDVDKVYYPGLPSHPDHELAKRQMRGFGGMVSFVPGGDEARVRDFAKRVKTLQSGREPRRRRVAALPSRADDARLDPKGGSRPSRRHR